MKQRPLAITVVGWLYIVVGVAGLALEIYGFRSQPFHREDLWIGLVRLIGVAAGVFMLRGANWARWLAIVWMAFHVFVGLLNGRQQLLTHAIIFLGITWLLIRSEANTWFRPRRALDGA